VESYKGGVQLVIRPVRAYTREDIAFGKISVFVGAIS
jgi:hypothetical protein